MSISISYKMLLRIFIIRVFIYYVHSTKSPMPIINNSTTMINQRKQKNYVIQLGDGLILIMLNKYSVSLDTVLHIQQAASYFTLFLESEYSEENIHYVLSVNEHIIKKHLIQLHLIIE